MRCRCTATALTGRAGLDRDTVAAAGRNRGGLEHGSGTGGEIRTRWLLLGGRGGWDGWESVALLTGRAELDRDTVAAA